MNSWTLQGVRVATHGFPVLRTGVKPKHRGHTVHHCARCLGVRRVAVYPHCSVPASAPVHPLMSSSPSSIPTISTEVLTLRRSPRRLALASTSAPPSGPRSAECSRSPFLLHPLVIRNANVSGNSMARINLWLRQPKLVARLASRCLSVPHAHLLVFCTCSLARRWTAR